MSYARGGMYVRSDVAERRDVSAAPVLRPSNKRTSSREFAREIDTLRSINAHLIQQVAILKEREAHAQRLADRDGLTGLYNRRRMGELLDTAVADARRRRQRVGLLFVDLDGFKAVNDTYGHTAGDKLLITVASRLAARARAGDHVCRYGGDEFIVILPRLADTPAAARVADSIGKRIAVPYRIDGMEVRVTAAVGVAIYPDEARTAESLLQRADDAMYREKAEGGPLLLPPDAPTRRREDMAKRRA